MTLSCPPQSLCSWNYRIMGTTRGPAVLTFNHWTEQGSIALGPTSYDVKKHGPLSGRWTLENAGRVFAEAHKPSALFRSFVLRDERDTLTLEARSAFGRTFDLRRDHGIIGTLAPMHPFTRRATIDYDGCSEPTVLMAFWLVALLWRRQSRNSTVAST